MALELFFFSLMILILIGIAIVKLWPLFTVLRFGFRFGPRTGARFPIAWQPPTEDNPTGAVYGPRIPDRDSSLHVKQLSFDPPLPFFTFSGYGIAPGHAHVLDEARKRMSVPMRSNEIMVAGHRFTWWSPLDRDALAQGISKYFTYKLEDAVAREAYEDAARYRDTIANIETLVDNELAKLEKAS